NLLQIKVQAGGAIAPSPAAPAAAGISAPENTGDWSFNEPELEGEPWKAMMLAEISDFHREGTEGDAPPVPRSRSSPPLAPPRPVRPAPAAGVCAPENADDGLTPRPVPGVCNSPRPILPRTPRPRRWRLWPRYAPPATDPENAEDGGMRATGRLAGHLFVRLCRYRLPLASACPCPIAPPRRWRLSPPKTQKTGPPPLAHRCAALHRDSLCFSRLSPSPHMSIHLFSANLPCLNGNYKGLLAAFSTTGFRLSVANLGSSSTSSPSHSA
ncbi:hypothetical protein B0H17DRAFT_1207685, partial [Mycena rosella]